MKKYVKVMFDNKSDAGKFEYKINEVNIANNWNPSSKNPEEMGGFSFSTEDKILRWILRGDTIYKVEIPDDAEVIECQNKNTPHGVFRTNKIIVKNPKILDDNLVMDLYMKSDLPEKTYFQCLTFLSLRRYMSVCRRIIADKVNKRNVKEAIEVFTTFFDLKEEDKNAGYKEVYKLLKNIEEGN